MPFLHKSDRTAAFSPHALCVFSSMDKYSIRSIDLHCGDQYPTTVSNKEMKLIACHRYRVSNHMLRMGDKIKYHAPFLNNVSTIWFAMKGYLCILL